jgi:hypothetical protein
MCFGCVYRSTIFTQQCFKVFPYFLFNKKSKNVHVKSMKLFTSMISHFLQNKKYFRYGYDDGYVKKHKAKYVEISLR